MRRISMSKFHTQRGRLLARRGLWAQAERLFSTAIEASATAENYYYLGNAQFNLEKFAQATVSTQRALELDSSNPLWHVRLGALYERLEKYSEAVVAYANVLEFDPQNEGWKKRLDRARVLAAAPRTSNHTPPGLACTTSEAAISQLTPAIQSVLKSDVADTRLALLSTASDADPENPIIHFHLAMALIDTGCLKRAIAHMERSRTLDPTDEGLAFHLGWALRQDGRSADAAKSFEDGIRISNDPVAKKLGPGVYFHRQGLWEQAAELYEDQVLLLPDAGDLRYRAGLARERSYCWEAAVEHHYAALVRDPESPGRHFHLGMAKERSSDLYGAIDAYRSAVRLAPQVKENWRYRLAYCLYAVGQTYEALQVFRQMSPVQKSCQHAPTSESAPLHTPSKYETELQQASLDHALRTHRVGELSKRGTALMEQGMLPDAITAFEAVVRQDDKQDSEHYFKLAAAQLASGDEKGALETFLNVQVFRRPVDVGNHSYFDKPWQLQNMEYVEFLEAYQMDESHVVFESYHGTKIDCNPAAIYRLLRNDPEYIHLRFTWIVNKYCQVPVDVSNDPRVSLVNRGSLLYRRVLATAKYLVTNVSFPQYYVRRPGQKYLNTWHGTPLKTLGKDLSSGFMDHSNIGRNVLQTTHLLAPNEHTQNSLIVRNEVGILFSGKIGRVGTPRVDRMMNIDTSRRRALFAALGIAEDGRKVVFYAPTWRGTGPKKRFDREKLESDLRALTDVDVHILFRAHHATERLLRGMNIEDVSVIPPEIDSYDILGITDVLVTDYSSIFFDFLSASKPIVFYAYDLEEYVAERGLYFSMDDMPGELARNITELTACVKRAMDSGIADEREHRDAQRMFAPMEDGMATQRAIDFFFAEAEEYTVDAPRSPNPPLLFRHDFQPGQTTDALITRITKLNAAGRPVVVLFDKSEIRDNKYRKMEVARLPEDVLRVARAGAHVTSLEERWNINQYRRSRRFLDDEQESIYRQAYEREFRRCLGTPVLCSVIQVSDLDPLGVPLLGSLRDHVGTRELMSDATVKAAREEQRAPVSWYDSVRSFSPTPPLPL